MKSLCVDHQWPPDDIQMYILRKENLIDFPTQRFQVAKLTQELDSELYCGEVNNSTYLQ
jgi:hypothetical protein